MITIDEKATTALRRFDHESGGRHPLVEAGRLSRVVGMFVIRLPDDSLALGKSAYDGSWTVLRRSGAGLLDEGADATWLAGRIDGEGGEGFMTETPAKLGDAFGVMIRLPSPILDTGTVLSVAIADAAEAAEAIESAANAPRP